MTEIKNGNGRSWTEMFRWITPILLSLGLFMLGNLNSTINKIDDKLFKHLTNDEIHISRNAIVDKNTFEIYQSMRDKQMCELKSGLDKIESLIMKHMEK